MRVVLASASPRRLELLRAIGVDPEVLPADLDELPLAGETPEGTVLRLAGQGEPGGGPAGDLHVHVRLRPHPRFTVEGADDLVTEPFPTDRSYR